MSLEATIESDSVVLEGRHQGSIVAESSSCACAMIMVFRHGGDQLIRDIRTAGST